MSRSVKSFDLSEHSHNTSTREYNKLLAANIQLKKQHNIDIQTIDHLRQQLALQDSTIRSKQKQSEVLRWDNDRLQKRILAMQSDTVQQTRKPQELLLEHELLHKITLNEKLQHRIDDLTQQVEQYQAQVDQLQYNMAELQYQLSMVEPVSETPEPVYSKEPVAEILPVKDTVPVKDTQNISTQTDVQPEEVPKQGDKRLQELEAALYAFRLNK